MNRLLILLLLHAMCAAITAQQADLRLNPELGEESSVPKTVDLSDFPFIRAEANEIRLNSADWGPLLKDLEAADSGIVSIVHIGDSHVQPEGNTSRTRRALQRQFGSAGRGLVAPLRLAGTNAPTDYTIRSESRFATSRLMKPDRAVAVGMSGVAIRPLSQRFSLHVEAEYPFDRVRVHSVGDTGVEVSGVDGGLMAAYVSPVQGVTEVLLTRAVTDANLHLRAPSGTSVTALELLRGGHGVEYSAIGNNGAMFSSYAAIPGFGRAVSALHPRLIVLSLGTNEAFGRMTSDAMRSSIDALVEELRDANPAALFLLTTPQECYRRSYTYSRRRKGRRRRRLAGYSVNGNVRRMRDIILDYAADKRIAVWDWYDISGGDSSAAKWLAAGLMNKDRIHLTWPGYHLQGELLADALIRQILSKHNEHNTVDDESVR